jgi:hypothetical protein
MTWGMVRPHMPPWMKFEGITPSLCNEFKLHIKLSGEGHVQGTDRIFSPTAFCALFANLLIFCKATFTPEDQTAAQTPSNATILGFIFLQNLTPKSMNQRLSDNRPENRRTFSGMVAFSLSVSPGDTITFSLPIESISISQSWQEALKKSLASGVWTKDFTQVMPSNVVF